MSIEAGKRNENYNDLILVLINGKIMRIILQVLDVHYRSILGGNMLLLIPGTLSHLLSCSELPDFMKLGHLPILTPEKFAAVLIIEAIQS